MTLESHISYKKYSWFLVGMVFLVILAGGVVRMTQSGMGCPDWPRCFGMWIPPTDASQLPEDFEKYLSKQDIDHSFNVYHTWIEYINRLLGAILGMFIFAYALWSSLKFSTRRPRMKTSLLVNFGLAAVSVVLLLLGSYNIAKATIILFVLSAIYSLFHALRYARRRDIVLPSILLLFAVAIQGWLGKIVVDENLSVVKITTHMIGALVIAIIPIISIARLSHKIKVSKSLLYTTVGMIVLVFLQIVLGTQVREEIDVISKSLAYDNRELWIDRLGYAFIIHRSFSWLILAGGIYLVYISRKMKQMTTGAMITLVGILLIISLGVIMAYLNMPALAQPLHLLFACALLIQLVYLRMRIEN